MYSCVPRESLTKPEADLLSLGTTLVEHEVCPLSGSIGHRCCWPCSKAFAKRGNWTVEKKWKATKHCWLTKVCSLLLICLCLGRLTTLRYVSVDSLPILPMRVSYTCLVYSAFTTVGTRTATGEDYTALQTDNDQ